jgi:3-isopropylmalate/(R)-2-methylmalate dehydratase small subunit
MEAFTRIQGLAAALLRENIDTDIIIASRDITSPAREGFGPKLFAPWRYFQGNADGPGRPERPDFVLNQAPWRSAVILIAGANFGCGSSREMAVWALRQFGFRCVIAPSFGAIFADNCIKNGVLPVVLPPGRVAALGARATNAAQPLTLAVDLHACEVQQPGGGVDRFEIGARDREMLLAGLDEIDLTWQRRAEIDAFEAADRQQRPWVWGD